MSNALYETYKETEVGLVSPKHPAVRIISTGNLNFVCMPIPTHQHTLRYHTTAVRLTRLTRAYFQITASHGDVAVIDRSERVCHASRTKSTANFAL